MFKAIEKFFKTMFFMYIGTYTCMYVYIYTYMHVGAHTYIHIERSQNTKLVLVWIEGKLDTR